MTRLQGCAASTSLYRPSMRIVALLGASMVINVTALPVCAQTDGGQSTAATHPEIPGEVSTALQKNADAIRTLSVTWKLQYRTDLPKQEAVERGAFPEGWDFFEPTHVDLYRDGAKFSSQRLVWRKNAGRRKQMMYYYKFDGHDYYAINEDPGGFPTVAVRPLEKQGGIVSCEMEYIDRCGFYHFETPAPDQSLVLVHLGRGLPVTKAEIVSRDGDSDFLIELVGQKRTFRFFLDPARGYALRMYEEMNAKGKRLRRTVNADFVAFQEPESWLPRRSDTVWHTWPSMGSKRSEEPLVYEELVVKDLSLTAVSGEVFTYGMQEPGLMVADARLPGADRNKSGFVAYQVPADPKHLEGVIQAAVDGKPFEPPMATEWRHAAVVGVNLVVLAAAGVWYCLRKRGARHSSP